MGTRYVSNYAGWGELLKSAELGAVVQAKAEEIADNVRAQKITDASDKELGPVETDHRVSDRQRASVTIKHPAAMPMQAKRGVLTKAAAAAGLEIKGRR